MVESCRRDTTTAYNALLLFLMLLRKSWVPIDPRSRQITHWIRGSYAESFACWYRGLRWLEMLTIR